MLVERVEEGDCLRGLEGERELVRGRVDARVAEVGLRELREGLVVGLVALEQQLEVDLRLAAALALQQSLAQVELQRAQVLEHVRLVLLRELDHRAQLLVGELESG